METCFIIELFYDVLFFVVQEGKKKKTLFRSVSILEISNNMDTLSRKKVINKHHTQSFKTISH